MNIKTIATIASALIASSAAMAGTTADRKCGAGSCSKKEVSAKAASAAQPASEAARDASCAKKEASCSKKEASCSKKEASCSKK
ncbi:hypothetical protein [Aquabacterium sp.]|uniref:hypothetical protein n=1 Tax=Aquabacterium sp. TaxID=1872578 RepID=UPI0035ADD52D